MARSIGRSAASRLFLWLAGAALVLALGTAGLLVLEAQLFGILVGISPVMLAIGLLFVAVRRSGLKPLLPLLWLLMGIGGNVFGWMTGGGQLTVYGSDENLGPLVYPIWIWLWLIPIWAIAALLFAATIKVCDKHLER